VNYLEVGDRVRYVGASTRSAGYIRYIRGTVVEVRPHDFYLAGALCSVMRTSIKLDIGNHTIVTEHPEHEWRRLDAVERLAELGR